MKTALTVVDRAPDKPAFGQPCNGCGWCCAAEVCAVGLAVFGGGVQAPCPALEFDSGRFWCGIARAAGDDGPLHRLMGIGIGCDSDDPQTEGQ